jgi:hypothetical protein
MYNKALPSTTTTNREKKEQSRTPYELQHRSQHST